ncbi:MAG: hypothetical protein ACLSHO_07820 [Dysosmobacter sp.]
MDDGKLLLRVMEQTESGAVAGSFEAAFCGDERVWLCRERIWTRRR